MKKSISLLLATAVASLFLGTGCGPGEKRVRQIAQEELSSGVQRTAFTDAFTIGPYSPAQKVGAMLFVSGQIALDQTTGTLRNADIETETHQALDNLMAILRKAGYDSSEVVSTTVYLHDIADYPKMNVIYGGYFPEGKYPARTTVQVAALPREARVEISAIAVHIAKDAL
jgi:2-iminobutanoate/2-iminopropanoate deaminase